MKHNLICLVRRIRVPYSWGILSCVPAALVLALLWKVFPAREADWKLLLIGVGLVMTFSLAGYFFPRWNDHGRARSVEDIIDARKAFPAVAPGLPVAHLQPEGAGADSPAKVG
jgi:hypothetical protein